MPEFTVKVKYEGEAVYKVYADDAKHAARRGEHLFEHDVPSACPASERVVTAKAEQECP